LKNNILDSDLNDIIDEKAVEWFIRLRADNVTLNEKIAFNHWLEEDVRHSNAFYDICIIWEDEDLLRTLKKSAQKYNIAPKPRKKLFPLALAASVLLVVGVLWHTQRLLGADQISAVGERKTIQLEDGSTAMLNTDSAVAIHMDKGQRLVELLKGEAYFDVKPNLDRPFVVRSDHSTTRVLGTQFFVHRSSDSDNVSVVSGRVEVSEGLNWKKPVVLRDNESVTVFDNQIGQPQKIASTLATSWINGFLVYNNETLESVINQINRYRSGIIVFKDDSLRTLRINGRLSLREPHDMLRVLQKTMDLKMTFLTDWVVIVG
jgi:transmembrane sensor